MRKLLDAWFFYRHWQVSWRYAWQLAQRRDLAVKESARRMMQRHRKSLQRLAR